MLPTPPTFNGKVGLGVVNAPHLPCFFQSQDKVGADLLRRHVGGNGHAGGDEFTLGVVALGGDDLEGLQGPGIQDDGRIRDIVADDDVLAIVGDGQSPRVEADAHLGHSLESVEVNLEQPAVAAHVVGPAVGGGVEGVAVGAVAGSYVAQ